MLALCLMPVPFFCAMSALSLGGPSSHDVRAQWSQYKATFNKTYAVEDEENRFAAFIRNQELIYRRNEQEGPGGATHGWTKFIDLTPEEFSSRYFRSTLSNETIADKVELPKTTTGDIASKASTYTTPITENDMTLFWADHDSSNLDIESAMAE